MTTEDVILRGIRKQKKLTNALINIYILFSLTAFPGVGWIRNLTLKINGLYFPVGPIIQDVPLNVTRIMALP
ncbi:hypothetical protein H2241_01530 [Pantoea ananatis]|uniref:hypothetical protein n=1 Tax=Pantoea ananas TaxID=553 RepID=UPI001588D363|nr:hypothetical protein [Pantoea ananatis]MBA4819672.1 hypothetical protein [Pantoea ananatis]QKV86524.1 hypothetical protein FOB88_04965 [Pantoea ananatis]